MNKTELLGRIRDLDLPLGSYVVGGGGVLTVRDIRETKDIDIIVLPDFFEELVRQGWPLDGEWKRKWNRKRIKKDDIEIYSDMYLEKQNRFLDIAELISTADMIEGIPFQHLDHLMMCKLGNKIPREKDLTDVKLIKRYLTLA